MTSFPSISRRMTRRKSTGWGGGPADGVFRLFQVLSGRVYPACHSAGDRGAGGVDTRETDGNLQLRRPAVSPGVQAPHDPYPRRGPGAHLLGEGDHSAQGGLPHQRRFPARYSRHYYDLWCMDKSPVKTAACGDLALLDRVYGSRTGSIHRVRPTMSWQNRARCDCFRQRSASLFCGRIMSIWKNMIFSSRRLWNVWRGWRGRSMGCEESSRL